MTTPGEEIKYLIKMQAAAARLSPEQVPYATVDALYEIAIALTRLQATR